MAQPDFVVPPPKKMRFEDGASPTTFSPVFQSPTTPYLQLPTASSPHPFNSPQPIFSTMDNFTTGGSTPGIMGPPMAPATRPTDRQQQQEKQSREQMTDMNTVNDVLFSVGLDLRAEEQAMHSSYYSQHSLNSQSSQTASGDSFSLPSFGPLSSQDPASQDTVEQELMRKHMEIARRHADRKQVPLYDSFLQMNMVRTKLQKTAFEHGVRLNLEGLYVKTEEQRREINVRSAIGPDGVGIVASKPGSSSWIQVGAQLVEVFSLLTLAANERLRTITEDAYAISRGRQATADGIVDPVWTELATGSSVGTESEALPLSITGTAWDDSVSVKSPKVESPKRKHSEFAEEDLPNTHRLPTPPVDPAPTPKRTKVFASEVTDSLRSMARQELEIEKARLEARERRKQAAAAKSTASATATDGSVNGADGSPATPATAAAAAQIAPDLSKMSKKEQNNLRKAAKNTSEDVLRDNANSTASMALGGRKRAWQVAAAASTPAKPLRLGSSATGSPATPVSSQGAVTAPKPNKEKLRARNQNFGQWKESSPLGGGIQSRDLAYVLERDGKAKRALARMLARQSSSDVPTAVEVLPPKP